MPAGGTITYAYQTLGTPTGPSDTTTATRQTTVTDRDGNRRSTSSTSTTTPSASINSINRDIRLGRSRRHYLDDLLRYDTNYRLLQETLPAGNTYHLHLRQLATPAGSSRATCCRVTETPDAARGGDQSAITTTYTYEPIYNQVHTMTEPRGNDPSYVPQNGGAQSAARYTTTYTYDYQEGTNYAALGAILGISAAPAQAMLAAAGIPMGLGDVNGDGATNQIAGNLIRERTPPSRSCPARTRRPSRARPSSRSSPSIPTTSSAR